MEKKFDSHKDFEFWSKELTSEEMAKLSPCSFDDKDLSTDFEWLHFDNYVEDNEQTGILHRIAFYNNNCLWQLCYSYNVSGMMSVQCVYSPSDEMFEKSFNEISKLICDESVSENSDIFEHAIYNSKERIFFVGYHYIDE